MKNSLILILILILMLCWSCFGTIRTWNGTDFGGTIAATDTVYWDGTSVANFTATSNIICASWKKFSTYTGAWNMSTYTITATTGDGVDSSTVGTVNSGHGLIFTGTNIKYVTAANNGTISSPNAVLKFLGGGDDTIIVGKAFANLQLIDSSNLYVTGSPLILSNTTGAPVMILGTRAALRGPGTVTLRTSVDCDRLFIAGHGSDITITGTMAFASNNTTGNITIGLPKLVYPLAKFQPYTSAGGTATFNMSDTLESYQFYCTPGQSGGNVVFATNGHPFKTGTFFGGSNHSGYKSYFNAQNTKIDINTLTGNNYTSDTLFCDFTGSTLANAGEWVEGTNTKISGTYTRLPIADLYMGHSMFTVMSNGGSVPSRINKMYRWGRTHKNKAIGGSLISNVTSRVDSCLTAYNPSAFFLWTGQNDLNITDSASFATAEASYWTNWVQIIDAVKTAGVKEIYSAGMSPYGTIASPMPAQKIINYVNFNSHMKDSCTKYNVTFIPLFDSLLEPGYTGVLKLATTTDGLHPNYTYYGVQYIAKLFGDYSTSKSLYTIDTVGANSITIHFDNKAYTIDSVYCDGEPATIVSQSSTHINFTPASVLMAAKGANAVFPLILYYAGGTYSANLYVFKNKLTTGSNNTISVSLTIGT